MTRTGSEYLSSVTFDQTATATLGLIPASALTGRGVSVIFFGGGGSHGCSTTHTTVALHSVTSSTPEPIGLSVLIWDATGPLPLRAGAGRYSIDRKRTGHAYTTAQELGLPATSGVLAGLGLVAEAGSSKARSRGAEAWRQFPTYTRLQAPGCYAFIVTGSTFTRRIIFRVKTVRPQR